MKIVVEGADNAGKSTLIRHLSLSLGIPVVPGEGPGRSAEEINDRVRRFSVIENALFDRHPCVSQPIYDRFRKGFEIDPDLIEQFYHQDVLFIYCRARTDLDDAVWREDVDSWKDASGSSQREIVEKNHLDILAAYDAWAAKHAHVVYRIGDGFAKVTAIVAALASYRHFDPVADIADFHTKFGLEYTGKPRVLPRELADFRMRFMHEELDEYATHEASASMERMIAHRPDLAAYTNDLEHMLDALVDEVYVVLGTAYQHGFNFREAWRRVHEANMKKVRAQSAEESKRGSTFDVVKPKDWTPPSHIDLVSDNDLSSLSS
jgi:predicted HAD superfamily Cof-like phosphohydrolase